MLHIQETFINKDTNCIFGESEVYESFTSETGELFKSCQKEYGRCMSKIYVDGEDGKVKVIGWVFEKRMQYEDSREWYTREVWVVVHEKAPEKKIEYFYHEMK